MAGPGGLPLPGTTASFSVGVDCGVLGGARSQQASHTVAQRAAAAVASGSSSSRGRLRCREEVEEVVVGSVLTLNQAALLVDEAVRCVCSPGGHAGAVLEESPAPHAVVKSREAGWSGDSSSRAAGTDRLPLSARHCRRELVRVVLRRR